MGCHTAATAGVSCVEQESRLNRQESAMDERSDPTTVFVAHRKLLFTVAYEMLGSAVDAEDVLQETWLRWMKVDMA
jgi:RNA polymerase sigma-70 factor (ECF subfamily)